MIDAIARRNEESDCWEIWQDASGWMPTHWRAQADFNCVALFFKAQGVKVRIERSNALLPRIANGGRN